MSLVLLIALPLAGALVVLLQRSERWVRVSTLAAAAATLGATAAVWVTYAGSGAGEALAYRGPGTLASVRLAADGLSVPLLALTGFLGVIAVFASWRIERVRTHMALLLLLEAAVLAVFLADDLVLFYVAWEAVLIPMFFLIGGWGHANRRYAAAKFFLYTFCGSALMLVGLVMLILAQGGDTSIGAAAVSGSDGRLLFWLLAAGLLVKVPVWPLHTWLPDAHVEAPTGGSIMLAGVLLKMGAYGIARVLVPSVPEAFVAYAPVLAGLGIVGIVYGAAMALGQRDVKRLVAYSSVAHMGFVVLALSAGTETGLTGAMLGMVSHGVVAGLLFFLVGALYDRAHTRDMGAFGGLGAQVPKWSFAFVVGSLASLGLPGLSGFPGEFAALLAGFAAWGWWVAIAGAGVVLAGAYALRAVRALVHREPFGPGQMPDLSRREVAAVLPLLGVILVLGVWPRVVTDLSAGTLGALASVIEGVAR